MLIKTHLQMFADGGAAAAGTATAGNDSTGSPVTNTEEAVENQNERASFDELINGDYKDDYQKSLKDHLSKRMKSANQKIQEAEERWNKVSPALEKFALKYGIDDISDIDSIVSKINEDNSFYNEYAIENGLTLEQAKSVLDAQRIIRENAIREQNDLRAQQFQQKYQGWRAEGEQLKAKYPSFDFDVESQNEKFRGFLNAGISVEDAYTLVHRDEIMTGAMAYTYNQAQQSFANTQRANAHRPIENGMSAQQAAVVNDDMSKITDAEHEKLMAAVRRGENVTPQNFRSFL